MVLLASILLLGFLMLNVSSLEGVWRYECNNGYCSKVQITPETEETALSLAACQLSCSGSGALWPKPTGELSIGTPLAKVNINSINAFGLNSEKPSSSLARAAFNRFKKQITSAIPGQLRTTAGGKTFDIYSVIANPDIKDLTLETDESYSLTISETTDGRLNATIVADNYFGNRHGLETLSQLTIYDDLRDEVLVVNDVTITDKPKYPYRGILLDTARNYISVDAIKKTLEAMGASKLNRFHWHITDSQSFPFTAESLPDLTKFGAYTSKKVYSPQVVADVVTYGLERGVRVIPEFDAPAHVGEGWTQSTDFITCFNWKPWQDYCVEPPCGQFDPTKDTLYDALDSLYGDMIKQFQQPDIFHMGGDEVHFGCWNNTPSIVQWMSEKGWGRSEADFVKLWDYFQKEALARLHKQAGKQVPVIIWTSTLTQAKYLDYVPNDQYIVQIWTTGDDPQVTNLLDKGYKIIISNYDAMYLDCGFSGWVQDGHNWCSPYKEWQRVYENTPTKIAKDKSGQVLGAEATLWTEQVDSANVQTRLWPRSAAMAEALWSETGESWRTAEHRFLVQRERLVDLGVSSDALEPEWCRQYQESCPLDGYNNGNFSSEPPADSPTDSTTDSTTDPPNLGTGIVDSITPTLLFVNIIITINLL